MSRQKPYSKLRSKQQDKKVKRSRGLALGIIGAVVLVALIVVVVLVVQNNRPQTVGAFTTVEKKDWPQPDGTALGPANSPVVIREFADFQCPVCKVFNQNVQPQIIDQYVKTGKIRYEFHFFNVIDMNTGGTESLHAAMASECAAEQGRFWDFHEMAFTNQQGEGSGAFSDSRLKAFAAALDLDTQKFNSCFDSQRTKAPVQADEAMARSLNVSGTPTLFVNGQRVSNALDFNVVKAAIDQALSATGK